MFLVLVLLKAKLRVATPLTSVAVPRLKPLAKKVTVPVGPSVPPPLTVAVKVTAWPRRAGLPDETTVVVVDPLLIVTLVVAELLANALALLGAKSAVTRRLPR